MNQITDTILMVRPAHFGFNVETADNNAFQSNATGMSTSEISEAARQEFDRMVAGLRRHGIQVIVIEDTEEPVKTDAVFPNNWFSTHEDGHLFLYPMFSPNRRHEVRQDVIDMLVARCDYRVIDTMLSAEKDHRFLESTGSMILDRTNRIIYACYSERTDKELLEQYASMIGYEAVGFDAVDTDGLPFYHTNVIMTLGENVAILCTESIVDEEQKEKVLQYLDKTNKKIINISQEQVLSFAGNMLQVKNVSGNPFMVMSTAAYKSLTESQKHIIEKYNTIFHSDLSIIEKIGGGSARCMMAEVFAPSFKT